MTPKIIRKNHLLGWGSIAVLVLMILLALANSPTVVRAMKSVFDPTPGIGTVEQNIPMRVLESPVTRERVGIKLTVRQVVINSEETVLTYTANNTFDDGPP